VPEPKCRAQTSTTAANHPAISIFRLLGLAAGVLLALPVAHGIGRLYRAKRTRRPALARRAYTVYYTARGQGTQHFAATLFSALIRARSNNSPPATSRRRAGCPCSNNELQFGPGAENTGGGGRVQAVLDLLNDVAARQPGGRVEATFP
jgi:hypothetical protein